jgi:uncharacterized protein (UPF0548 family)
VFLLRAPNERQLSHFLARQRTSPLTYTEIGASLCANLPAGYHHVRTATPLPSGAAEWAHACDGIRAWAAHAGAGMRVTPAHAPIEVGTVVAVIVRLGLAHAVGACRIVQVVYEPDRYGFAYGTLPSHPEEGEESFVLVRLGDTIRFEVAAFSRPHDLLTRLGGPVARAAQRRATRQYLDGMRAWMQRGT